MNIKSFETKFSKPLRNIVNAFVVLALALAGCLGFAPKANAMSFSNQDIVRVATSYTDGTYVGVQCLAWVENVIRAAGGPSISMGNDTTTYQSQWSTWATQVAWSQAQPGDIIQFAQGSSVHTVILLSGNSESTAQVIQSNLHLDLRISRSSFLSAEVVKSYAIWHLKSSSTAISGAVQQVAVSGFEAAFEANTSSLWSVGNDMRGDWQQGMMPGTSPSITRLTAGGYEIAFQANTGSLITVGSGGNINWQLGMMKGTSPSITAVGSGFEVAFQANTGSLWSVGTGTAGSPGDRQQGMMAGTSPSITAVGSGYEIAFQANTGSLITIGSAGNNNWQLGMMKGTSPSITAVGSGFEVAFQANTGNLWSVGTAGSVGDWKLGMMNGTSPAIARQ